MLNISESILSGNLIETVIVCNMDWYLLGNEWIINV